MRTDFDRIVPDCTGFYLVLLGFKRFYLVFFNAFKV